MAKRSFSKKPEPTKTQADAYELKKQRERNRQAQHSAQGRDIGPCPPVADPARRAKAQKSFRVFCETYFRESRFPLAWSKDHLTVIARIEETVLRGGLFALAMPRGSGKTSLCEAAAIWALLIGARRFVVLIGASAAAAEELLESERTELEVNELLGEDFPEVCYPIRRLEGSAQLCARQLSCGERTRITYGKRVLVLPTIPGSKASGAILRVAGITGRIRGMKFVRSDGTNARPDFVLPDDPQTDKSAASEKQCKSRTDTIGGAVLGLAGPGKKIAGVMPCTVIQPGDMVDRILDRVKHPRWRGERMKALYSFPTNMKLWEEYAEIRRASLRNGGDGSEATKFYKKHRKEMDAGAVVAWPDRYEEGEISGLQHQMNAYFDDERAFMAERQQEPVREEAVDTDMLSTEAIATKTNGLGRGVVPLWGTRLTLFVDMQHRLLYWTVCAWSDSFNGAVIDYGTWPEQPRAYFDYRNVRHTLQKKYPSANSVKAAVRAGLTDLCDLLLKKRWRTEAGAELSIERALLDSKDGTTQDAVYEFCRSSPYSALLYPSEGIGLDAVKAPMHEFKVREGERLGFHWLLKPVPTKAVRKLVIDANFWKSFIHERLMIGLGGDGCLSLFGDASVDHRMFAEQLTAEKRTRVRNEKSQRTVDVWTLPAAKPDNHFLDCVCGSAVAASLQGCELGGRVKRPRKPRAESNVTYLNL